MHLDPAFRLVEEGAVAKTVQLEIGVEVAIEASEDVQVEGRGDARRVVVRGIQGRDVLSTVNADDQRPVVPDYRAQPAQKRRGFGGMEVSDRRAGKKRHAGRA